MGSELEQWKEEKIKQRAHQAEYKYNEAMSYILRKFPLFGVVLHEKLPSKQSYDIQAMSTDGTCIKYNPDFVRKQPLLTNVFVIIHECGHNICLHSFRMKERDMRLWNVACDYQINSMLTKMGVGEMPKGALLEERFDGSKMSVELIYDILLREGKDKEKEDDSKPPSDPHDEENNSANNKDGETQNNPDDMIGEQYKEEIAEAQSSGWVEKYEGVEDPNGEKIWSEELVQKTTQEMEDSFAEALAHGQMATRKSSGEGSINWHEVMNANKRETISWEDALREFLNARARNKKNWNRPHKKWLQQGYWMPSKMGRQLEDIVVMVDESGSMSEDEVNAVFSNLRNLFEDKIIPLSKVAILHFASRVDHVDIVEHGDIPEYIRHTNGGTDFDNAFKKAQELELEGKIRPACYIVMTDMEDRYPPDPGLPVLWMSTTDPELRAQYYWGLPEYGKITHLQVEAA